MKKLLALIAALLVAQSAFSQFVNGNKLKDWSDADERSVSVNASAQDFRLSTQYLGYLQGSFDAQQYLFPCTPSGLTTGQLAAIVTKYLKDNPEQWTFSGNYIVNLAMKKSYPCK